jgi:hypothetical protein
MYNTLICKHINLRKIYTFVWRRYICIHIHTNTHGLLYLYLYEYMYIFASYPISINLPPYHYYALVTDVVLTFFLFNTYALLDESMCFM